MDPSRRQFWSTMALYRAESVYETDTRNATGVHLLTGRVTKTT